MDSSETDASPRNDGPQSPDEQGDTVDWSNVTPYRGRTPPDHDEGWRISSIPRRFLHGTRAATTGTIPTGEPVVLGDPHWYVTSKHDRFPASNSPTTEYEHYVFSDASTLAAWFGEDAEIL